MTPVRILIADSPRWMTTRYLDRAIAAGRGVVKAMRGDAHAVTTGWLKRKTYARRSRRREASPSRETALGSPETETLASVDFSLCGRWLSRGR